MILKALALTAIAGALPLSCDKDQDGVVDCGAVVVIEAGATPACDVDPPSRLDVRYPGSDGIEEEYFQGECDWQGGTLVWSTAYDPDGEFNCEGVDY